MSNMRPQVADSATRIYGIVGDPIAQVKSPTVFNEKFRALGKNAVMIPLHAEPGNFDSCMHSPKRALRKSRSSTLMKKDRGR